MKRYKLIALLSVIAIVAVLFVACATQEAQLTVTLNGKEVKATDGVYSVEYANDVAKVVIEATTTAGEVKGTGTFNLQEGENTFSLTLTVDGKETTYTVKVTRKASEKPADVTLAEVKIGGNNVLATDGKYVATVDYETDKIAIAASAIDSNATVEGTGEKALNVGKNEFTVTVKNGKDSATYSVEITRAAAVLTLAEVKVGEVALTADADGVYTYTAANALTSVVLSATATKSYATVEGVGEKTLALGENTFTVTVKVDDNTKQTYTVIITREAADLTLAEVKVNGNVLTADNRTYTANVANDVTEVTIVATANNTLATVSGAGTKGNLVVGENSFDITVSVGEETATYKVVVNRAKSSVKTIANITVDGANAAYDAETATYTATVAKFTAKVQITLSSQVATYVLDEEIGTLAKGDNEFVITVTAEDGTTAAYTLVLKVVLPMHKVSYTSNIAAAVKNQEYSYEYGSAQTINILLGDAYTQSYDKLTVTYKIGEGAAKTVTLNEDHAFTVPSDEAIGDIVVDVQGIVINTYKITYHRDGKTTEETVEHGQNAQNAAITPSTETKDVLDGYTYLHDEKWVTEENGMVVANLTNITASVDVYYKDEVLVRSEVNHYTPGAYKTVLSMNSYLKANADGSIEFKVLVKSTATDGTAETDGKTSFLIYEKTGWTKGELGVSVKADEIGKWFTVKANADMVRVYRPDGTVASEMKFEEYNASTLSFVIHADAAVAAINPAVPELCTVTYFDGDEQLHVEKVIKGTAATYTYSKAEEDLGDGYKRLYNGTTWLAADGSIVDLSAVTENITVTYKAAEKLVYVSCGKTGYSPVTTYNKFVVVDSEGNLTLKVRPHGAAAAFNMVATNIWQASEFGQWVDNTGDWWTVKYVAAESKVYVYSPDGSLSQTKDFTGADMSTFCIVSGFESIDIATAEEVVNAEYYDVDKTTLLHSELILKRATNSFEYVSDADSEGYMKSISQWTLIDGSTNKFYAVKPSYSKATTVAAGNYASLATLNKYIAVDSNGVATFKVKFTFSEWTSFKFSANSGWTALEDECNVGLDVSNSGKWFTIVIDTTNDTVQVIAPDGTISKSATDVTEDNVLKYAFLPNSEMPIEILF